MLLYWWQNVINSLLEGARILCCGLSKTDFPTAIHPSIPLPIRGASRPHVTEGKLGWGKSIHRWGKHLTPDSSDNSPIKNPVEWLVGRECYVVQGGKLSKVAPGIDPMLPTLICAAAAAASVKVARQAGRSGQVAFRPPAGWAGPSMIWRFWSGMGRIL